MSDHIFIFILVALQAAFVFAGPRSRFIMHMLNAPTPGHRRAIVKCGRIVARSWLSSVQTRVQVKFRDDMIMRFYASAYPTQYKVFNGAIYNMAMAKRLVGKDLNAKEQGEAHYDMVIQFNMKHNWYLGLDGRPGPSQIDLITLCLHELLHGLFNPAGTIEMSTTKRGYWIGRFRLDIMHRYDQFLACETAVGDCALVSYNETSNDKGSLGNFGRCVTSNALWFRTENARIARIYAPIEFQRGSSISHLDESSYQNENSLLTPLLSPGYVKHDLDPLVLRIMNVMMNRSEPGAPSCNRTVVPYVHSTVLSPISTPSPSPSAEGMVVAVIPY